MIIVDRVPVQLLLVEALDSTGETLVGDEVYMVLGNVILEVRLPHEIGHEAHGTDDHPLSGCYLLLIHLGCF